MSTKRIKGGWEKIEAANPISVRRQMKRKVENTLALKTFSWKSRVAPC